MFKLRTEKGRQQVRRQIARPNIDPGVLVDLAAKKLAAIRSLFPKDLGSLIEVRIVDQQRAAFSAREILGLMETESCKLPEVCRGIVRDIFHKDHAHYLRQRQCHAGAR